MGVIKTTENRIGKGKAGPGRPKGLANKVTREAKEAIAECFERMGGVDALVAWSESNQKEFYTVIWPKIIPLTVGGDANNPLRAVTTVELIAPGLSESPD